MKCNRSSKHVWALGHCFPWFNACDAVWPFNFILLVIIYFCDQFIIEYQRPWLYTKSLKLRHFFVTSFLLCFGNNSAPECRLLCYIRKFVLKSKYFFGQFIFCVENIKLIFLRTTKQNIELNFSPAFHYFAFAMHRYIKAIPGFKSFIHLGDALSSHINSR